MSYATTFLKQCPSCGRRLEIRVQCLGKNVQCTHCGSIFTASNSPANPPPPQDTLVDKAIRDAEIYLASVEEINQVGLAWHQQHPQPIAE